MDKELSQLNLQEAWQLAIDKEKEAQTLYKALMEKATTSGARELFKFLMEQEVGHEQRLQDEFDKAFRSEW